MFAKEFTWPGVIAWSCEIPVVRTAFLLSRFIVKITTAANP
jgi:hypothetical protein